jgi:hypothetical protein
MSDKEKLLELYTKALKKQLGDKDKLRALDQFEDAGSEAARRMSNAGKSIKTLKKGSSLFRKLGGKAASVLGPVIGAGLALSGDAQAAEEMVLPTGTNLGPREGTPEYDLEQGNLAQPEQRSPEELQQMMEELKALRRQDAKQRGFADGGIDRSTLVGTENYEQLLDMLNPQYDIQAPYAPEIELPVEMETPQQEVVNETNEILESPNSKSDEERKQETVTDIAQDLRDPMQPSTLDQSLSENREPAGDPQMDSARNKDALMGLLNSVDTATSHWSAANPYANLKPVKSGVNLKTDREDKLRKERKGSGKTKYMKMGNKIIALDPLTGKSTVAHEIKGDDTDRYIYRTTPTGIVRVDKQNPDAEPKIIFKDEIADKRETRLGKGQALREGKFALSKDIKNRLSDKEVDDLTKRDDGIRLLDDIDRLLKSNSVKKHLGEWSSRFEEGKKYTPIDRSKEFVEMQQMVGIQLANYIKSISGAQVSEQEAQRLLKNLPNMKDKPAAFKAKLVQMKKEWSESRKKFLDNIGKQKSGAKKFDAEHQKVVEWLEKNPDHPKAEKVRKKLEKKMGI